jgi:hypothetical protein
MTVLSPQAVAEMALLKAAEQGDLTTLERLVDQGVDVDARDGVRPNLVPQRHLRLYSVPPSPPLARPRPSSASITTSVIMWPNCVLTSLPSSPIATLATHAV